MKNMRLVNQDWTDVVPQLWGKVPLKSKFSFSKGLSITKADLVDAGFPVISYGQIHSKQCSGVSVTDDLIRYVSNDMADSNRNSITFDGDIVFADTSEDLEGCGNAIHIDTEYPIFAGYHTIILKKNSTDNSKYYAYLFRTDAWRKQIRVQLTDVKLFSVSQGVLKETYLVVPSKSEQDAIVSFLDKTCAQIDEAISRHRHVIEKLEEYKSSIILQKISAITDCRKTKYLFKIYAGATPKSDNPDFWDGNIIWITPSDFKTKDKYVNHGERTISLDGYNSCNTTLVPSGAIILSKRAPIGTVCIANTSLCTNQGCLSCVPREDIDSEFYYYVLSVYSDKMNSLGSGTTFQELSAIAFANMKLPYLPFEAQRQVSSELQSICADVEQAIIRQNSAITQLEEYRKAVIYNAVTGKIDCRSCTQLE